VLKGEGITGRNIKIRKEKLHGMSVIFKNNCSNIITEGWSGTGSTRG
jgi:hypothetical protein